MEVDIYNNKNQTYWSDPDVGQFGAQAVSASGYASFYPPAPFGGVRYIQPLPRPQVFYWTPPQKQPKAIEPAPKPAPKPVKPELACTSYVFFEVFAFMVTVFCNCVFGTIAWVLALIAHKQSADDPKTARNYGWASCGMAAAGIVATMIIVGVTVGVLLSDQCQYYYVNGVCYRTQSYAATGCNPYNNVNLNKCCSNGEVYIYDGTKGYCYKQ